MGMVAGAGCWLMARGWWPAPRPVGATVASLARRGRADDDRAAPDPVVRRIVRCGRPPARRRQAGAAALPRRRPGLLQRTPEAHAIDKLQTALFGAGAARRLLADLVPRPSACPPAWSAWRRSPWESADGSSPTSRPPPRPCAGGGSSGSCSPPTSGSSPSCSPAAPGTEEALQDAAAYGTGWGFSLLRRCVNDAAPLGSLAVVGDAAGRRAHGPRRSGRAGGSHDVGRRGRRSGSPLARGLGRAP